MTNQNQYSYSKIPFNFDFDAWLSELYLLPASQSMLYGCNVPYPLVWRCRGVWGMMLCLVMVGIKQYIAANYMLLTWGCPLPVLIRNFFLKSQNSLLSLSSIYMIDVRYTMYNWFQHSNRYITHTCSCMLMRLESIFYSCLIADVMWSIYIF